MARMIPAILDETAPPGEKELYRLFAGGPDDWVIIHSLDLAPVNRGLRTEIDFLVIVPRAGILCLEVKSHERIECHHGVWSPPSIKRSPFKQAADGKFAFYRRLREAYPKYRAIPVAHCCVFPRAEFRLGLSISINEWELLDKSSLQSALGKNTLYSDIVRRIDASIQSDDNLQPLTSPLSSSVVEELVNFCSPFQLYRPDKRGEIESRELEAMRLLQEHQKPVLVLADLNDRILIEGGAGTGKTFIALELARRLSARGERVGLVCFNRLIGSWLCKQFGLEQNPNLQVGTAIKLMAEMTGVKIPESPSTTFWEEELPERIEEKLTDPDLAESAKFDYLIVDEGQDLLARPRLWCCVQQFLAGGLAGGRFAVFGDFRNQVLADHSAVNAAVEDLKKLANPCRWLIQQNCRNYRVIGDAALSLAGLPVEIYSGYLRTGGSIQNYDIHFYQTSEEQLEQLGACISKFRSRGYKPNEIVCLSFSSTESSIANTAKDSLRLAPYRLDGHSTMFSSIHAFKGMESKVVLICDVDLSRGSELTRHLFYTAMTRATEHLEILCSVQSQSKLLDWIKGRPRHAR